MSNGFDELRKLSKDLKAIKFNTPIPEIKSKFDNLDIDGYNYGVSVLKDISEIPLIKTLNDINDFIKELVDDMENRQRYHQQRAAQGGNPYIDYRIIGKSLDLMEEENDN